MGEDFDTEETTSQKLWALTEDASRAGGALRVLGSSMTVLSVVLSVVLAITYLIELEGIWEVVIPLLSLLGSVPVVSIWIVIYLYGTRGVISALEAQERILDRDTAE